MSDLAKLLPLAVALTVIGGAIVFMLQRQMVLGTWLLAVFLLGHGLVHVMFAVPAPAAPAPSGGLEYPFDVTRSWLVTGHVADVGLVRALVFALVAATVIGYTLTALATVGVVVPSELWPTLLVASTLASGALMVIGLGPVLALGIAIDVALLLVVVSAAWRPGALTG